MGVSPGPSTMELERHTPGVLIRVGLAPDCPGDGASPCQALDRGGRPGLDRLAKLLGTFA